MAQNPPEGSPRIVARLAYEDLDAAVAFLEQAFGFQERAKARIAKPDGSIALTEIEVLDSHIMVGAVGAHGLGSPRATGTTTAALIVYVDRVDAHFERAKAAGATIISEPADQFWGDRRYEAADAEGHLWSFHEHVRDVPQAEIDAVIASFGQD
jgi:uncharacterized glyoxalase superfamily protein PhnB